MVRFQRGGGQDLSANAILTANITVNTGVLDEHKNLVSKSYFIEWIPIGTFDDSYRYTGTFNGNSHTISGLYFNNPNSLNVGLFGCIGAHGKISNVGVLDSYFQFGAQGGGVCGINYGELQNCSNSSTVISNSTYGTGTGGVCGQSYGTVRDCKNTGSVSAKGHYVGGVCGYYNYSEIGIENCFNEGTVSGRNYVGGVCGYNEEDSKIENCFNKGTVGGEDYVGGVCGENAGTIKSCYNTADVYGTGNCVGSVCGSGDGAVTNCYYLSGKAEDGSAVEKSEEKFASGEVAHLLAEAEGKALVEQVWGQQLGEDPYPVLYSDYKVIKAAKGNNDTYWATFSNQTNDATLSVPSDRTLNVYNAMVSGGKLTLTERDNHQVAMDEGVLLKTDGGYVNAKANEANELTKVSSDENHLVATPAEATTVTAETGYILYRLTYNDAIHKDRLGFYLGSSDGNSLKATPGKAYLKVSENEAKAPSSAALTRSFVFGGGSETTGIEGITIMGTDVQRHGTIEGIFDLQGRKIVNPTKGIYIKNNKKVIIK